MKNTQCWKLWICVACMAGSMAAPAPYYAPISFDIIDMAAISRMTPQQLETLAEGLAMQEIMRTKRSSSSAQVLQSVVSTSKASSGLQSKIGFLGQASAGAASFVASASSKGGHDEHPGYNYEPQESKVDFWGLKKSILYTLFQAVKAITGGVTILKGQLIKGGGHLAATVGKVISVKGEAVSNLGKKIVNSAALSQKKPHSPPVYGPPAHVGYPPSAYGAPTAPAHYSHSAPAHFAHSAPSAPSAPSGYSANKYPAHLDGRGHLNGVHAGLVILAPLGEEPAADSYAHGTGHTPLEPPPSILTQAFGAIKNVFSQAPTSFAAQNSYAPTNSLSNSIDYEQPPPPQPVPPFKPMAWGAVNSYGEPAMEDSYNYDPRNTNRQTYDYTPKTHGLTPEKLNKIADNLDKLTKLQRSSEELPVMTDVLDIYRQMLEKGGKLPILPTPVVTDAEIGVLPAESLPAEPSTTSSTTTSTTTAKPSDEKTRRRKDVKYFLRGNKIVQV